MVSDPTREIWVTGSYGAGIIAYPICPHCGWVHDLAYVRSDNWVAFFCQPGSRPGYPLKRVRWSLYTGVGTLPGGRHRRAHWNKPTIDGFAVRSFGYFWLTSVRHDWMTKQRQRDLIRMRRGDSL